MFGRACRGRAPALLDAAPYAFITVPDERPDETGRDRGEADRAGQSRTVEGIHRSTTFHWVGNGFHVSTYFPSASSRPSA